MKPAEGAVALAYFAACVAIALACRRRARGGSAAYWAAERGVGAWVNGVGTFSTLVSAASFLGFLGLTCRLGWSMTAIALGAGPTLAFVLSLLLVSGPLRRYSERRGKFTLSNFLMDRFGPAAGALSSALVILIFSAYIVPQLIGGAAAAQYVLGIPWRAAVAGIGAVFVFYVLVGGMLSVTWTDFLQGILMFALMVGLAVTAVVHFGGPAAIAAGAERARPYFLDVRPGVSVWTYVGFPLGITVFVLSSPHTIMRLFTAKDVRQGRSALSITAALCLVFHLVGYFGVGAAALVLKPDLADGDSDRTYLYVMDALFPTLLRGLAVSAILAAIMSTTAGLLLAVGAEFSVNVYRRVLRPSASDAESVRAGQVFMLLVGIATTLLALVETKTIGTIVGQLVQAMGSAFAVPLLAGLWWPRASRLGGFFSMAGGFGAYLIAHYGGLPAHLGPFTEILVALPASIFGLLLGTCLSPAPDPETRAWVASLHSRTAAEIPRLV
ncbi:MAG TPA: hypothetical protein VEJ18_05525 [Planctomycetota bacterium]|nr:hypothetical protein [Planctomycetota bacterium]